MVSVSDSGEVDMGRWSVVKGGDGRRVVDRWWSPEKGVCWGYNPRIDDEYDIVRTLLLLPLNMVVLVVVKDAISRVVRLIAMMLTTIDGEL